MIAPLIEVLEPRRLFAATRIMPLGDSITEGYTGGYSSYRYWLWNALRAGNYDVDFVGGMHGVHGAPTPGRPDFDQDHEGHSGWRADQVLANAGAWATQHQPDVVLMHLGTNDMLQGQSVSSTITEIGSVVDALRQSRPNVVVLMAQIIPSTINATAIQQLNAQIATLAAQKNTEQSPVVLVDQWGGFSTSADEWDGIHPNEAGELKMANRWFGALQNVLRPSTTPPPATVPLSSFNWSTVSNGFGPVESNRSVGGSGLGDGNTLRLNGATYASGLGMHASAEATYAVKRQFREFRALVGIDDEAGANGSAAFRVYVDNVLRFDSGLMTATTPTKFVRVSLTDARVMRLAVNDGGNGPDWDHGDWVNATLFRQISTDTPTSPPPTPSLTVLNTLVESRHREADPEGAPAPLDESEPIVR
jgi:acyl-CoA thioesterase I